MFSLSHACDMLNIPSFLKFVPVVTVKCFFVLLKAELVKTVNRKPHCETARISIKLNKVKLK